MLSVTLDGQKDYQVQDSTWINPKKIAPAPAYNWPSHQGAHGRAMH